MKIHKSLLFIFILLANTVLSSKAAEQFISFSKQDGAIALFSQKGNYEIAIDANDYQGIFRAANSLISDINEVTGCKGSIVDQNDKALIIVGSIDKSSIIQKLVKNKAINIKDLKGKTEKYIITTVNGQLVIAGSDKRGTTYGIYELSRQLGISPWHWWADVPAVKHEEVYALSGTYTDGEPVVRYRGIFLNDEAPCLSGWVEEKFPDSECPTANPELAHGMNSNFYCKVFELLLRLKANYLWPAMWNNAFYADDSQNSALADEMGIIMGTSHHEPMARNHQEWARHREENGAWDYATNQKVIDDFFREGIRRAKNTEDIITIGMRGDGDAAMGGKEGHDDEFVSQDDYYINLYEKIFKNQRQIIKEETGKTPEKVPQMWAIYKEVQHYYDLGLKVPEDVLIMLCDDNWGNIRRVPGAATDNKSGETGFDKKAFERKGGWGMYYHVDYVGAPRNSKWANVTPIAHLWEQMNLCYSYGIDRLWILNVGDLKPMEYPIDLFLNMAWNPNEYADTDSFRKHTQSFCESAFGKENAKEATRLMELYCIYNGRVTPEMLNFRTYNLASGEYLQVVNEYKALEAEALRLYHSLGNEYKDAFYQLLLFPIQSMSNLYELNYAHAMNQFCYCNGLAEANDWADVVEKNFARDQKLTEEYHALNGGKWNHMMDQTHIGYFMWQQPHTNIIPEVKRLTPEQIRQGGFVFSSKIGYVSIEAEHYYSKTDASTAIWQIIPTMGRTKSALELLPNTAATTGASISYKVELPKDVDEIKLHVITNSTLPYLRSNGHRYTVSIDGGSPVEVNYNGDCTEENTYHTFDVVATRIIETETDLKTSNTSDNMHIITITPIDPGMALEKIIVDYGGYEKQHLFGTESSFKNETQNEWKSERMPFGRRPRQQ